MAARALNILIASLLLTSMSSSVQAADDDTESRCKKALTTPGHPHTLKSVAEIKAVANWSEKARKHGEEYAQWLYAKDPKVECNKIGKAGLFLCHAGAKPCLPPVELQSNSTDKAAAGRS